MLEEQRWKEVDVEHMVEKRWKLLRVTLVVRVFCDGKDSGLTDGFLVGRGMFSWCFQWVEKWEVNILSPTHRKRNY
eukprot:4349839-Ditylum_brightwellii.AAC.1